MDGPTDRQTLLPIKLLLLLEFKKIWLLKLVRAINWLYMVNMEISMVKTKVGCYGNQILALQPCGGNPYGA